MLTPEEEAEIEAIVAERDEVLLACDVDRMIAFHAKYNPGSRAFSSREVAEIALSWPDPYPPPGPPQERIKAQFCDAQRASGAPIMTAGPV